jgi:hypothetical protein
LVCHDGSLGSPEGFSVAGTVFERIDGASGANGVTVLLEDAAGAKKSATTNTAGNFYVLSSQWHPRYPLTVSISPPSGPAITMQSLIGWSGSCATCHTPPVGPDSAGPVAIELEDGGTPP